MSEAEIAAIGGWSSDERGPDDEGLSPDQHHHGGARRDKLIAYRRTRIGRLSTSLECDVRMEDKGRRCAETLAMHRHQCASCPTPRLPQLLPGVLPLLAHFFQHVSPRSFRAPAQAALEAISAVTNPLTALSFCPPWPRNIALTSARGSSTIRPSPAYLGKSGGGSASIATSWSVKASLLGCRQSVATTWTPWTAGSIELHARPAKPA